MSAVVEWGAVWAWLAGAFLIWLVVFAAVFCARKAIIRATSRLWIRPWIALHERQFRRSTIRSARSRQVR